MVPDQTDGLSLDTIVQASGRIGIGRETRYRDLLLVRMMDIECSSEWAVVDAHIRAPVAAFDSSEFETAGNLRGWLDEQHESYWGE